MRERYAKRKEKERKRWGRKGEREKEMGEKEIQSERVKEIQRER